MKILPPRAFQLLLKTRVSVTTATRPVPFSTSARAMASEYKLKGLSSLDLGSGEKREVEVEGIENGKILLVRVGKETHALSSNCTHYGAPLKNGVVTAAGRLVCPWHGGECSFYCGASPADGCPTSLLQYCHGRCRRCPRLRRLG